MPDLDYATLAETVSEADRRWFQRHPGATEYLRPIVPGECPPGTPGSRDNFMLVIQLYPGARARHSLRIYSEGGPITELVHGPTGHRWNVHRSGRVVARRRGQCEAWQVIASDEMRELITLHRQLGGAA